MIKTQLWRPDTCECVIEQTFDYSTTAPTLVDSNIATPCKAHSKETKQDKIVVENVTKNNALSELAKITKLTKKQFNEKGQLIDVLDESMVSWTFDKNRELVLDVPALTTEEKATALTNITQAKFK